MRKNSKKTARADRRKRPISETSGKIVIIRLRKQLAKLKSNNLSLRKQIRFLTEHKTLAAGMRGEQIIATMIGGKLTATVVDHDLLVRLKGRRIRIEIKKSNLNIAFAPRKTVTKRWSWRHVLGNSGAKKCHRVILVGEIDKRYHGNYKDPRGEYVFFDLSRTAAERLMSRSDGLIQLTTNPDSIESSGNAAKLYKRYQVTSQELKRRYRSL